MSTSHRERPNATDRHRSARKGRKPYRCSKDGAVHAAGTAFTRSRANCCWPVRALRERGGEGPGRQPTPAMAADLADQVWSPEEWLTLPGTQR